MSLNIPRDMAKELVIETFKRTRRITTAAKTASVPVATARRWLFDAGFVTMTDNSSVSAGMAYVQKGPDPETLSRVDREPCFKCGVRRDVGCKHHPKEVDPAQPLTARDKAERLWKGMP